MAEDPSPTNPTDPPKDAMSGGGRDQKRARTMEREASFTTDEGVTGVMTQKPEEENLTCDSADMLCAGTIESMASMVSWGDAQIRKVDTPLSCSPDPCEHVAERMHFDETESAWDLIRQSCDGNRLRFDSLASPMIMNSPQLFPSNVDRLMLDTRYQSRGRAFVSYIDASLSFGSYMPPKFPMDLDDTPPDTLLQTTACTRPLQPGKWYSVAYWRLYESAESPSRSPQVRSDLSRAFSRQDLEGVANFKQGFLSLQQKMWACLKGDVLVFFKVNEDSPGSRYCFLPRPHEDFRMLIPRTHMSFAVYTLDDLYVLIEEQISSMRERRDGPEQYTPSSAAESAVAHGRASGQTPGSVTQQSAQDDSRTPRPLYPM